PWRYYRGLNSANGQDYFQRYYQFWQRLVPDDHKPRLFQEDVLRGLGRHSTFDTFRQVFRSYRGELRSNEDFVNASLYFELKTFLHGLLIVEDKLSMAHSLETRVPFLDDDLVEFAVQLSVKHKLRQLDRVDRIDENNPRKRRVAEFETNEGKRVLREAMK